MKVSINYLTSFVAVCALLSIPAYFLYFSDSNISEQNRLQNKSSRSLEHLNVSPSGRQASSPQSDPSAGSPESVSLSPEDELESNEEKDSELSLESGESEEFVVTEEMRAKYDGLPDDMIKQLLAPPPPLPDEFKTQLANPKVELSPERAAQLKNAQKPQPLTGEMADQLKVSSKTKPEEFAPLLKDLIQNTELGKDLGPGSYDGDLKVTVKRYGE